MFIFIMKIADIYIDVKQKQHTHTNSKLLHFESDFCICIVKSSNQNAVSTYTVFWLEEFGVLVQTCTCEFNSFLDCLFHTYKNLLYHYMCLLSFIDIGLPSE